MFFQSFLQTLPVLMGYLPLGIAFGILFAQMQFAWYYGILCAVFVFTGAGQFLLISLLSVRAGFLQIAVALFLLNMRHMFYSLALLEELKSFGVRKYYILFGLTDETFALLKSNQATLNLSPKELEKNYFYITLLNHLYWILGCGIGIFLGEFLRFSSEGVEFVLTALFSVLTLVLLKNSKNKKPFFIAFALGVLGLIFFPSDKFLILALVCGVVLLIVLKKWIVRVDFRADGGNNRA